MKKKLAILLEDLETFETPKLSLEQYPTPSGLAAEIAVTANLLDGDKDFFIDLGCGTGVLAIAMSLVGFKTLGVDIDFEALKLAVSNAKRLNSNASFVLADVRKFNVKGRVGVVMNPPFGIKRRHADKVFLEKAFEIGSVVYSVHSAGSEGFVRGMADSYGFEVTHCWKYRVPMKKLYRFHKKPYKFIAVEVFRMEWM